MIEPIITEPVLRAWLTFLFAVIAAVWIIYEVGHFLMDRLFGEVLPEPDKLSIVHQDTDPADDVGEWHLRYTP